MLGESDGAGLPFFVLAESPLSDLNQTTAQGHAPGVTASRESLRCLLVGNSEEARTVYCTEETWNTSFVRESSASLPPSE
jgi:hypothetical protein